MCDYVVQVRYARSLVDEHGEEVFLVHWFAHVFEHTADLRNDRGIRVDPGAFEDTFEVRFEHGAETLGEFEVSGFDDERGGEVEADLGKCNEHGELPQHLAFGRKPTLDFGRAFGHGAFVLVKPCGVVGFAFVGGCEWARARLEFLAELDTVFFGTLLFFGVVRPRDDVVVRAEHEGCATCEAGRQKVLFHVAFEFVRGHAAQKGDVGSVDVITSFVLRINIPYVFGP